MVKKKAGKIHQFNTNTLKNCVIVNIVYSIFNKVNNNGVR